MMGKKTPLYEQHLQAKAKMVDFHGWEMPLHYGSQINEHHQVRQQVGVFDISHMTVIDVYGEKAFEFLSLVLANDVGRLKNPGKALYSCMLNEQGGIVDDLIVYYLEQHHYRLVVNAATRTKDLAWLNQHAPAFGIHIQEGTDLALLAVQGPLALEKLRPLVPAELHTQIQSLSPFRACWNDTFFVARTGYTGENGFELIVTTEQAASLWAQLLASGVSPIGLGARDTLRLEAGLKLYGVDLDETHSPLESDLSWTIAWSPPERDFIGRQALQAQRQHDQHPVMVGLILQEKGILREHQTVHIEGDGLGAITSGGFSPTLGVSIAFARLPAGVYEQVTVTIRNKQLPAQVVKPPFVRYGKACVNLTN